MDWEQARAEAEAERERFIAKVEQQAGETAAALGAQLPDGMRVEPDMKPLLDLLPE